MRKFTKIAAGVAMVLALSAGSCDEKGTGDAPVGETHEPEEGVNVWNFPNTYSNVAFRCIGANGVYVITADRFQVVPNDENCSTDDSGRG